MIDDVSERTRRGEGETLELNAAADMLESLAARNRALEGENAALAARCGELQAAITDYINRCECTGGYAAYGSVQEADVASAYRVLRALASQAEGER